MNEKIRTKESIIVILEENKRKKIIISKNKFIGLKKLIELIVKFWVFQVKKNNILVIIYKNGFSVQLILGKNLVTNDGDLYYAKKAAGEIPICSYVGIRLGTGVIPVTKNDTDVTIENSLGRKLTDEGYPRTDDPDPINTESDVDAVTWRFSYTMDEGNITGIAEGAIVNDLENPTSALTHFLFNEVFDKTDVQAMKIFVNHKFNGV